MANSITASASRLHGGAANIAAWDLFTSTSNPNAPSTYGVTFSSAGEPMPGVNDTSLTPAWVGRVQGGFPIKMLRSVSNVLTVQYPFGNGLLPLLWQFRYMQIVELANHDGDFWNTANTPMLTWDFGSEFKAVWGAKAGAFVDASITAGLVAATGVVTPSAMLLQTSDPNNTGNYRYAASITASDDLHMVLNVQLVRNQAAELGMRQTLDVRDAKAESVVMRLASGVTANALRGASLAEDPATSAPTLRTLPDYSLELTEPAIVAGMPYSPRWWARSGSTATVNQGPDGVKVARNMDPVWDPVNNVWEVEPPLGGAGDLRWTTATFPTPAPGQRLGDPSSYDFTGTQDPAFDAWATAPGPGSDSALLRSFWPFRPQVLDYYHFTPSSRFLGGRAVQLNSAQVEHMFVDFDFEGPQTWVMAAMISAYPSATHLHPLLDGGGDLRTYRSYTGPVLPSGNTYIPQERADYPSPRPNMEASSFRLNIFSKVPDPRYVAGIPGLPTGSELYLGTDFDPAPRPRMFAGVWNGDSSFVGNYSTSGVAGVRGRLPVMPLTPSVLIGRRCGYTNSPSGADLLLFEIRWWRRALSFKELQAQYDQLSTTWGFSRYG